MLLLQGCVNFPAHFHNTVWRDSDRLSPSDSLYINLSYQWHHADKTRGGKDAISLSKSYALLILEDKLWIIYFRKLINSFFVPLKCKFPPAFRQFHNPRISFWKIRELFLKTHWWPVGTWKDAHHHQSYIMLLTNVTSIFLKSIAKSRKKI